MTSVSWTNKLVLFILDSFLLDYFSGLADAVRRRFLRPNLASTLLFASFKHHASLKYPDLCVFITIVCEGREAGGEEVCFLQLSCFEPPASTQAL